MGCGGSTPDGPDVEVLKNVSGTFNPLVYTYNGGGSVACYGDKTAVCVGGLGITTVDISDPTAPKKLASVSTQALLKQGGRKMSSTEGAGFVSVLGSHAFIIGSQGMLVVDISTPAEPKTLAVMDTGVLSSMSGGSVFVDTKYAYVVGGGGMRIFDVSDPAAPKPVGDKIDTTVNMSNAGGCVTVKGGLAYITGGQGFAVFDVKDPAKPTKLSVLNTGVLTLEDSGCVALVGQYAYVGGIQGLCCIDVSNPAKPALVGSTISTGVFGATGPGYLQYDESRKMLYVSSGMGLAVFDVSEPADPTKACANVTTGVYTPYGGGFNLLTSSGKYLLAAGGAGLVVFEIVAVSVEYEKPVENDAGKI